MYAFSIYTKKGSFIIKADAFRFIREKGGYCRYEILKDHQVIAAFSADNVNAIIQEPVCA
ncbi:MAG: hypothetical protein IKO53_04915 [Lachnospiraceae bacterium]|nr:hypothetical protein [Lachnospiraceae bacterium]